MWLVFMWGGTKFFFHLQRTMEIGDQRGRGAASFLGTTVATAGRLGRDQKIFYLQTGNLTGNLVRGAPAVAVLERDYRARQTVVEGATSATAPRPTRSGVLSSLGCGDGAASVLLPLARLARSFFDALLRDADNAPQVLKA